MLTFIASSSLHACTAYIKHVCTEPHARRFWLMAPKIEKWACRSFSGATALFVNCTLVHEMIRFPACKHRLIDPTLMALPGLKELIEFGCAGSYNMPIPRWESVLPNLVQLQAPKVQCVVANFCYACRCMHAPYHIADSTSPKPYYKP